MNAVPDEKQGVASAVNDATREVGAALGIAVAGSVLAAQYSSVLAPALTGFPEQVRAARSDPWPTHSPLPSEMGPQGARLADLATSAFIDSMSCRCLCWRIVLAVARRVRRDSGHPAATAGSSASCATHGGGGRPQTMNSAAR